MYEIVSVCLYTSHAWPQARKKLLLPPELISLNLQGGANPPRNPPKVRECRLLPGAVFCNKWICTAHPGAQLPADTTAAKGEETISKASFIPSCSTCVLKDKRCTRGRGAAAAQLKMFCQLIEARFQTSPIKKAPLRQGGTVRSCMWAAVTLWEYLQDWGLCFAVCRVGKIGWVGKNQWVWKEWMDWKGKLGWKEWMGWKGWMGWKSDWIVKGGWVEEGG